MKTYPIFLASSYELHPEREKFEIFISRQIKRPVKKNVLSVDGVKYLNPWPQYSQTSLFLLGQLPQRTICAWEPTSDYPAGIVRIVRRQ